ncbi:hypothetical protein BG004_006434 [Podila humilis]|nr:hypothetical protein BG004_006434 [Podila humilis]
MRKQGFILALSFSIAVITAAPVVPTPSTSTKADIQQDTSNTAGLPTVSDALFEALDSVALAAPSSFLIEFDLAPAGITRHERLKMEVQEFHGQQGDKRAVVAAQHQDLKDYLTDDLQVEYSVRHEFYDLMNGLSIDLQGVSPTKMPKILEKIRSIPGVIKVSPLISMNQPKTIVHDIGSVGALSATATPQLSTAHEQTGVLDARNKLGLAGHGIKVGIIDTGVDFTHEALGSCYGVGCKVQYGYDFVDYYHDETPGGYDCVGHGTHVAGIIAGNSAKSNFFGVAPQGSSKDDVIIAALEKAYDDGMDVVNLSLGGGSSWANTALAKAAGRLVDLGVVVVAAIGNDGEQGLFEVSSPSIHRSSISVGSFEGAGYLSNYFETEGNSGIRIDYGDVPPNGYLDKPLDLVVPAHDIEGCNPYPDQLNGAIVLLKRGSCTFALKIKLAQEAGAIGCIFYNNAEGGLRPKVDEPGITIFGHGITMAQGQAILDQFSKSQSKTIKITYKSGKGVFTNEMANQMSVFSSWGLGPELELKPDIAAPGGYIYSTVPVAKGSYSTMSGTSMATPYIAGAAALMVESDATLNRKDVLGRLQMYSKPGNFRQTTVPDTVVRQGAGMVHIYDSIRGKAIVEPSRLALNDTVHTQASYTLTLTNQYPTAETFSMSHVGAMAILGYNPQGQPTEKITYKEAIAEVDIDQQTFTVEAGATHTINVRFKPPKALEAQSHWLYSGYVRISPTNDITRPAVQVPYAGMIGSYGSVDMLALQDGFPIMLGAGPDGRPVPVQPNHHDSSQPAKVYTMSGNDVLTLLLKVSNPLRNLQVYVMDSTMEKILGMVPVDGEYIGRTDSTRTKFFAVPWSGRIITPSQRLVWVPDGEYALLVVAPKPFSSEETLSVGDHESWVSPRIAIKRRTTRFGFH